ncbi:MAG: glycosyltransferase family 4 protein [Chloroflexota bacterium]|nr:glycosyltransferase family 4 protein [Chloroflexota bacterium]
MRLLYLGSTDFPQPKARAIQIVNTCHALARAGAEVTLVVGRRGRRGVERGLRVYGLAPHPRLRIVRVPIFHIPPTVPAAVLRQFTRVWQASYLAGLATVLPRELAIRRPDVVFARDLRTARIAARPTHATGAKLAFEVHGLPSYEVRHGAGRSTLPPAEAERLRRLESEVFARADRIVTITECARRILLGEYGVPEFRVRTVADGTTILEAAAAPMASARHGAGTAVLVGAAPPPDAIERGQHPHSLSPGGPASPPILGGGGAKLTNSIAEGAGAVPHVYYVGQLYPWKGAGLVVDVAGLVPEAHFVVVGGTPAGPDGDPDVAALTRRIDEAGAGDRVELRGYVPYGQVPAQLREASVALLPLPDEPVARYFTSPLKLFDYMAAGVPIVASDLPSIREVLRHGENGLLATPGDLHAFAGAVRCLLNDPAYARRLGDQAREDVRRYSWDARASRLLEFLA